MPLSSRAPLSPILLALLLPLVAHGSVGALVLPWLVLVRRQFQHRLPLMLLLTLLGGIANLAFAVAIVRGDVVRVMVLFYLLPAWGVLGGRVVLG